MANAADVRAPGGRRKLHQVDVDHVDARHCRDERGGPGHIKRAQEGAQDLRAAHRAQVRRCVRRGPSTYATSSVAVIRA